MKTAHDLVTQAKNMTQEISLHEAEQAMLAADVLLDVREADEYAAGHLRGAVLMPRGLLEFKLSASPALSARDIKVVVYCKTSGRAALAAQTMQAMGYLNVASIAGGYDAWVAAGKAVVRPEQPSYE
ncbi:rhodanese-like domain-containing protein [Limnohabitans lacus]|uniref:Rhodanese-like domain-containing protein n=1 Tax=Limnohabitans lacus TaxID=3045173 RepID=A0ABT6X7Q1_9BURK|nr:rhodanese-like domain-containing protein [Limnohabitans sp. HM2-2]MDI9234091.1 rhodanese-like domain-containing protein [Limnohabitans sp. HM2-2]